MRGRGTVTKIIMWKSDRDNWKLYAHERIITNRRPFSALIRRLNNSGATKRNNAHLARCLSKYWENEVPAKSRLIDSHGKRCGGVKRYDTYTRWARRSRGYQFTCVFTLCYERTKFSWSYLLVRINNEQKFIKFSAFIFLPWWKKGRQSSRLHRFIFTFHIL